MVSLLLAAALVLPQATPKTARHVFTKAPKVVISEDISSARVNVWVRPDGKVVECKLSRFLGNEQVATKLCAAIVGARMTPARDSSGSDSYAFLRTTLGAYPSGWEPVGSQQARNLEQHDDHRDLLIDVGVVPGEFNPNSSIVLKVEIAEDGTIAICERDADAESIWSDIACAEARRQSWDRRTAPDGSAVKYIREIAVMFEFPNDESQGLQTVD